MNLKDGKEHRGLLGWWEATRHCTPTWSKRNYSSVFLTRKNNFLDNAIISSRTHLTPLSYHHHHYFYHYYHYNNYYYYYQPPPPHTYLDKKFCLSFSVWVSFSNQDPTLM